MDNIIIPAVKTVPKQMCVIFAGLLILVVQNVAAIFIPPYVPQDIFHVVWGVLYAWLVFMILRGRNWTRVLITILLVVHFVGKFFVFVAESRDSIRLLMIFGWLVTLIIIWLLWIPKTSRDHFKKLDNNPSTQK